MVQATVVVPRDRLARALAAAPVGIVEAPGGYGKTTLLRQVVELRAVPSLSVTLGRAAAGGIGLAELWAELGRAARRAGWVAVAQLLGGATDVAGDALLDDVLGLLTQRDDALLVVVDEVQRATEEASAWLRRLALELPPSCALLAAGRRVPDPLAFWPEQPGVIRLDRRQLRFDRSEVAQVLDHHGVAGGNLDEMVDDVMAVTDGWPAAVALAASLLESGHQGLEGVVAGSGLMTSLVRRLLADLPEAAVEQIRLLARLPLVDDDVVAAIGAPGALAALMDAGLPWSRRADGWWLVPDPVKDVLGGDAELQPEQRRAAAAVYRDRGQLSVALTMLASAGDHEGLVALLGGCPWQQLSDVGLGTLRVILDRVPPEELRQRPEVLVRAARVAEQTDPRLRRAWLTLARDLAVQSGDSVTERAALAEMTRDAIRVGDDGLVEALAQVVLAGAGPDELVTRGRVLAALGQLDTVRASTGHLATAEQRLEEAALLFRMAGERTLEADALLRLGYAVSFHGGNFERAIEQLHEVLALLPAPDRPRGDALTFLADVLDVSGRPDEADAAAREALAIGRRIGDSWVVGAARWAAMLVAGHRGDVEGVRAWLQQIESHPAPWMEVGAGVEFYVDACDLFAANGLEEEARRCFDLARQRAHALEIPQALSQIEMRLEATFGDPERAEELLAAAEGMPYAVQRHRWTRALLRSLAAHRRRDAVSARTHAEIAVREAELLGDAAIIWRLEGPIAEQLADYLPATAQPSPGWSVTLLGGFQVRRGVEDFTPPPGHPSTLVKLVALRGSATSDEVIDHLWPDVDLSAGRRRLRNLLNRLRDRTGPLVVRRDSLLQLDPQAVVDAVRFEQLANEVLAAEPEDRVGLARRCLGLYGGELLPGDRFEEWTAGPRERLRRRFVALVDMVADDAQARGDLDEAVVWMDTAIRAEPYDHQRYLTAASLLARQGRRSAARAVAARGIDACLELGLGVPGSLVELEQRLGAPGSSAVGR